LNLSTDPAPKPAPSTTGGAHAPEAVGPKRKRASRAPSRARATELERLWSRYRTRHDDLLRNQLVEHYQPLVEELVRRFALRLPRNVDRGDLSTAANVGLMGALEGFDPERGVRFESYCELRVKGALLDELRTQDWLPRPWRARIELQKRTVERLRGQLSREPDEAEIALGMDMPLAEYRQLFGLGQTSAPLLTPTAPGPDDDSAPGLDIVADGQGEAAEEKLTRDEILRLVAQKLTVQEYRLVYLKYWEELSMREIGQLMDLSESRVCKMHMKLLERLKDRLRAGALD